MSEPQKGVWFCMCGAGFVDDKAKLWEHIEWRNAPGSVEHGLDRFRPDTAPEPRVMPRDVLRACRACGIEKLLDEFNRDAKRPDGRRSTCRSCTRAAMARWHDEHPEWQGNWREEHRPRYVEYNRTERQRFRTKFLARHMLQDAVASGRVQRPDTCVSCGRGGRIEGHHDDYSKPLEARWLCVACHRLEHRKSA